MDEDGNELEVNIRGLMEDWLTIPLPDPKVLENPSLLSMWQSLAEISDCWKPPADIAIRLLTIPASEAAERAIWMQRRILAPPSLPTSRQTELHRDRFAVRDRCRDRRFE
jgi:hypothetical protein